MANTINSVAPTENLFVKAYDTLPEMESPLAPNLKVYECVMNLVMSKSSRDESFFGLYDIYYSSTNGGSAIIETTPSPINIIAPVFVNKVAKESDYFTTSLGYEDNVITDFSSIVTNTTGLSFGFQSTEMHLMESAKAYADDAVRFNLTLQLDPTILKKGVIVYQYLTMKAVDDASMPNATVGCRVTIGDPNSVVIDSFSGTGSMLNADNNKKTIGQQNVADKQDSSSSLFTENILGRDVNHYKASEQYGLTSQSCMADIRLAKGSNDLDTVFQIWEATIGARIYQNQTDANPILIPEFPAAFDLYKPDPTLLVDPEVYADFDEVFDDIDEDDLDEFLEDLEVARAFLKEEKIDITIASGKYSGSAEQKMKAAYNNIPIVDRPDQIEFVFKADIPITALETGRIIYQYADLVGITTPDLKIGVACKVEVGNPDGVEVMVFKSGSSKPIANKLWWEINIDNEHDEIFGEKFESDSYY